MNEPQHWCRFDCNCPADDVFAEGWNSAIDAVCKLVEIDTPNIDNYTSKQLAERIYVVLYGEADECNTSTQEENF